MKEMAPALEELFPPSPTKYLFTYLAAPGLSWGPWTLSCSMWDPVLQPGIEARTPALGAWSLSHWTTREAPWRNSWWREEYGTLENTVQHDGIRWGVFETDTWAKLWIKSGMDIHLMWIRGGVGRSLAEGLGGSEKKNKRKRVLGNGQMTQWEDDVLQKIKWKPEFGPHLALTFVNQSGITYLG